MLPTCTKAQLQQWRQRSIKRMRQCKQLLVKYVERGMTLPGYGRAGPSLPPRWQDNVFSGKWSVLGWSERKLLHQGAFFCPRIDRALHWNFRCLGQKFFGGSSRDWSCCWKRGGARYGSGKTQIKRTGRSSGQEGNLLIYLFWPLTDLHMFCVSFRMRIGSMSKTPLRSNYITTA